MTKAKKKKEEEITPLHIFEGSKMDRLKALYDQWYGCQKCLLGQHREGQDIVFGDGNPDAPIMIIGEAPGAEEEETSIPFIGASGRLLNQILSVVSDHPTIKELVTWYNTGRRRQDDVKTFHEQIIEWRRTEFFITNIVCCRPLENRTPLPGEMKACWERLYNMIYIVDPWLIITSGKTAAEAVIRKRIDITKQRGTLFEIDMPGRVTSYKIPVLATLHPSYLLRQADWNSRDGSFMATVRDYRAALTYVDHLKNQNFGTPIPERQQIQR